MMSLRQTLPFGYSPELECRVLELPFTQRRISVFFLLPDDQTNGLNHLEGNMTTENIKLLFGTLQVMVIINQSTILLTANKRSPSRVGFSPLCSRVKY